MAVSRNTSSDEASEWCCVHDIQTVETRYGESAQIILDVSVSVFNSYVLICNFPTPLLFGK